MKKAKRNPRGRWLLWFKRKLAKVYSGLRGGLMCIRNHKRQFLIYQDTEEGERLLYIKISRQRPLNSYRNDIEIKSGDDLLKVIRKLIFDINTLPLYPILLGVEREEYVFFCFYCFIKPILN